MSEFRLQPPDTNLAFVSADRQHDVRVAARASLAADPRLLKEFSANAKRHLKHHTRIQLLAWLQRLGGGIASDNTQPILVLSDAPREIRDAGRTDIDAEETFGAAQISYEHAAAEGGPLLQAFLARLRTTLAAGTVRRMSYVVSLRAIVAPWHTDNNGPRSFRRFAVSTGEPTLFLRVADLPRFATRNATRQRVISSLVEEGALKLLALERGSIYSWGNDEWHKTPEAARRDDLMIVAELVDEGA